MIGIAAAAAVMAAALLYRVVRMHDDNVGIEETQSDMAQSGENPPDNLQGTDGAKESGGADKDVAGAEKESPAAGLSASVEESLRESSLAEESLRESSLAEESLRESSLAEESLRESSLAEESLRESSLAEELSKESSLAAAEESRIAGESRRQAEEEAKAVSEAAVVTVSKSAGTKVAKSEVAAAGTDAWFTVSKISDSVFSRMKGKSFGPDCTVQRDDLRYLKVLHYGPSGEIYVGELVCHKDIASSLSSIFRELYDHKYPIQKMHLVDDYGADDIASAADNNTSCFNFRISAGDSGVLSRHAYGKAIDINPLYNPYVWTDEEGNERCDPSNGSEYVNRSGDYPYKLDADDFCVKLFKEYGFKWGGDWGNEKDYMHFSV